MLNMVSPRGSALTIHPCPYSIRALRLGSSAVLGLVDTAIYVVHLVFLGSSWEVQREGSPVSSLCRTGPRGQPAVFMGRSGSADFLTLQPPPATT
jgi:hypothetical protein